MQILISPIAIAKQTTQLSQVFACRQAVTEDVSRKAGASKVRLIPLPARRESWKAFEGRKSNEKIAWMTKDKRKESKSTRFMIQTPDLLHDCLRPSPSFPLFFHSILFFFSSSCLFVCLVFFWWERTLQTSQAIVVPPYSTTVSSNNFVPYLHIFLHSSSSYFLL